MTFPQSIFTYYLVESKTFGFELLAFCNLCKYWFFFANVVFFNNKNRIVYVYFNIIFLSN